MIKKEEFLLKSTTEKNKNERYYSPETLQKCLEDMEGKPTWGLIGYNLDHVVPIQEIAFQVENPQIINDGLYGDIKVLDTPKGRELKELLGNSELVFRPAGVGMVHPETGEVYDYKLTYFAAVPKDTDAFEGMV
jgi:hypothetical protein